MVSITTATADSDSRKPRRLALILGIVIPIVAIIVVVATGIFATRTIAGSAASQYRSALGATIDKVYSDPTGGPSQQVDVLENSSPTLKGVVLGSTLSGSYRTAQKQSAEYDALMKKLLPVWKNNIAVSSVQDVDKAYMDALDINAGDLTAYAVFISEDDLSAFHKDAALFRTQAKGYAAAREIIAGYPFTAPELERDRVTMVDSLKKMETDYTTIGDKMDTAADAANTALSAAGGDSNRANIRKAQAVDDTFTADTTPVVDDYTTAQNAFLDAITAAATEIVNKDLVDSSYDDAEKYSKQLHAFRKSL